MWMVSGQSMDVCDYAHSSSVCAEHCFWPRHVALKPRPLSQNVAVWQTATWSRGPSVSVTLVARYM
jgi:hypothetical protein